MASQQLPRIYSVIIERDEDGLYIGEVSQLKACYGQGASVDELMINIKEVIEMCQEEKQAENTMLL